MKSLLLGLTIAAFTAGSAAAAGGCSYGMAKMSEGQPAKHLAQSQSVKPDTTKTYEFVGLTDAWLIKYLSA